MISKFVKCDEMQAEKINNIIKKLHAVINGENAVASLAALIERLAFVIVHICDGDQEQQQEIEDCIFILKHYVGSYREEHKACAKYRKNENVGSVH